MQPIEFNFKLSLNKAQILSLAKHLGYQEKVLQTDDKGALIVPWIEVSNPQTPRNYVVVKAKEYVKGFVGNWTDTLVKEQLEIEKTQVETTIKKPIEDSLETV